MRSQYRAQNYMRGKKKLKVDESKVLNKDLISQESTDREN